MKINLIKKEAEREIDQTKSLKELEEVFRKYLGKKGEVSLILRSLKNLPEKEKKEKGLMANKIKKELSELITKKKDKILLTDNKTGNQEWIDVTAPGILPPQGYPHPISLVQEQIEESFKSMGFSVIDGPEVETEYYNFDALNIPKNHPARDQWDTFWLKNLDLLLRTHTSPMQARYMEKHNPSLRIIVPGRCFRHEATDASHDVQFYQVEGLMVGKDISIANFKGVIETFLKDFFGSKLKMRLRPGYFPFTEPSFEIDIKMEDGKWLEVMGAGMVHPNIFKSAGYLPNKWQGFAFGVGIDRLAMLKYKIDDIRLLYSNNLRFLKQF